MKKIIVLLLGMLALLTFGCGQTSKVERIQVASYPNWVQIKVGTQAAFSVPPDLTVQTEADRMALQKNPKLDALAKYWVEQQAKIAAADGCVIVQNGQMAPVPWEDPGHYAWVEFKTLPSKEVLPRYGQNLGLTGNEIKDFGQITQKTLEATANKDLPAGYAIRFSNWQPMESVIVNGVETLHTAFTGEILLQGNSKCALHGERWTLFNRDRIHTLMVVWNQKDDAYWQQSNMDLKKIITTLEITPSEKK